MNYLEVNQTGGFPLTTNILNHLQNASAIFNAFGELAGDFTIISGCKSIGSMVNDGVVYFNGELFPFKGGVKTTKVRIIEMTESKTFQDGVSKAVVFKRHVEFGSAAEDFEWSQFRRIDPLITLTQKVSELEKTAAVFTQGGGMVLWQKPANEIPEGWQEVVNWRGRMPVGFDAAQSEFNSMGKTGGSKTHKLTNDEAPAHTHNGRTNNSGNHSHSYSQEPIWGAGNSVRVSGGVLGNWAGKQTKQTSYSGSHAHDFTTNASGGGDPHNNLSPYRVVMFIERI